MLAGELEATLRSQHHQCGRQAIGLQRRPVEYRHRRQLMLDRTPGVRVERMRITPAGALEVVAIVTRGGNRQAVQLYDLLGDALIVTRRLDSDPPG